MYIRYTVYTTHENAMHAFCSVKQMTVSMKRVFTTYLKGMYNVILERDEKHLFRL